MPFDFKSPIWFLSVSPNQFEEAALALYKFQAQQNVVFQKYLSLLGVNARTAKSLDDIVFMPVSFFKNHQVITGNQNASLTFKSSATTGQTRSQHSVVHPDFYLNSLMSSFNQTFGTPQKWNMLALLPGYVERGESSLVYMVNSLMQHCSKPGAHFYLQNQEELLIVLESTMKKGTPTILWGVSFALLDLSLKTKPFSWPDLVIVETGGMKGKLPEKPKAWLHEQIRNGFNGATIYSEYGMTELLSQSYALSGNAFVPPPWLLYRIRNISDPFETMRPNQWGGVNMIDLANTWSCAFLATDDLGRLTQSGLELAGRIDYSELRGCQQLYLG